jgi:hypothetical protein
MSKRQVNDAYVSQDNHVFDLQLTSWLLVRCHFGKTTDGKTFEEFLGHDGYYQHLESTFDDFLHASFSKFSVIPRRLERLTCVFR